MTHFNLAHEVLDLSTQKPFEEDVKKASAKTVTIPAFKSLDDLEKSYEDFTNGSRKFLPFFIPSWPELCNERQVNLRNSMFSPYTTLGNFFFSSKFKEEICLDLSKSTKTRSMTPDDMLVERNLEIERNKLRFASTGKICRRKRRGLSDTVRTPKSLRKLTFDDDTAPPVSGTIIVGPEGNTNQKGPLVDIDPSLNFVEVTEEAREELARIENKIGDYICRLCKIQYNDAFSFQLSISALSFQMPFQLSIGVPGLYICHTSAQNVTRFCSAFFFLPLLLLVPTEAHFPAQERFLFGNLFNPNTRIVLVSNTATITKTVNPTCIQLLSASLPPCQRKKRQIFLEDNTKARNFLYRTNFIDHHAVPLQFAAQYIRPVELFDNLPSYTPNAVKEYEGYKENDLIEPSIKAPAAAEGRFFLSRPSITVTTDIATVTVTQMAGVRETRILSCFPPTGVSEPFCSPSVLPEPTTPPTTTPTTPTTFPTPIQSPNDITIQSLCGSNPKATLTDGTTRICNDDGTPK